MSVMPIVCETVAAGLACGRGAFGGCRGAGTDAAPGTIRTEMSKTETRLIEIMVESPYCKVCGALSVAVEVSRKKVRGEFTTFYKHGLRATSEKERPALRRASSVGGNVADNQNRGEFNCA